MHNATVNTGKKYTIKQWEWETEISGKRVYGKGKSETWKTFSFIFNTEKRTLREGIFFLIERD